MSATELAQTPAASPLVWMFLVGIGLLAYLKIGIVLAVLRRGLGSTPPALVTGLLAALLSVFAMNHVINRSHRLMTEAPAGAALPAVLAEGLKPVQKFLHEHTRSEDRRVAVELARRLDPSLSAEAAGTALRVELLAFALGEVKVAFRIGLLLLVPFLLIDLLCASLLSGFFPSVFGLSVRGVALPFKLLVFLSCDGWNLLVRGLLFGYADGGGL